MGTAHPATVSRGRREGAGHPITARRHRRERTGDSETYETAGRESASPGVRASLRRRPPASLRTRLGATAPERRRAGKNNRHTRLATVEPLRKNQVPLPLADLPPVSSAAA